MNKMFKTVVSASVVCLFLIFIAYAFVYILSPRLLLCFKSLPWIDWIKAFSLVVVYFGGMFLLIWSIRYFIDEGLDNIKKWIATRKVKNEE